MVRAGCTLFTDSVESIDLDNYPEHRAVIATILLDEYVDLITQELPVLMR